MEKNILEKWNKVNKMLNQPITDNEVVKTKIINNTLVIKVEPKKNVKTNT